MSAHENFKEIEDFGPFKRTMDVNFFGYVYPTRYALEHLEKDQGQILVMSSYSGDIGLPSRASYCASKFAVNGFFESLKMDMQPKPKVDITIVGMSRIATNMRKNSLTAERYAENGTLSGTVDKNPPMSIEKAVDVIVSAADARVGKAYADWGNYFSIYLRPVFPFFFDPGVSAKTRL